MVNNVMTDIRRALFLFMRTTTVTSNTRQQKLSSIFIQSGGSGEVMLVLKWDI